MAVAVNSGAVSPVVRLAIWGDPRCVNEGYVNDGSGAPGGIRAAGEFDRAE